MSYLLLETGDRIILEDGSGFLLLEDDSVSASAALTQDNAALVATASHGILTPGDVGPDAGNYRLLLALCNTRPSFGDTGPGTANYWPLLGLTSAFFTGGDSGPGTANYALLLALTSEHMITATAALTQAGVALSATARVTGGPSPGPTPGPAPEPDHGHPHRTKRYGFSDFPFRRFEKNTRN